jgi:hypothetical protein
MKGLIRRLQKYPIKIPGDVTISVKLQQLYPWFNGRHSYDEICTKTGKLCCYNIKTKGDKLDYI